MSKRNSNETEIAQIFSVPLTKSGASKEAEQGAHEKFKCYIKEHVEKMFEDSGELSGFGSFKSSDAEWDYEVKIGNSKVADFYFFSDHVAIIGEAKVSYSDLKDSHTDSQLLAYAKELKTKHPDKKKMLVLSIPYGLQGIARMKLEKMKRVYGEETFSGIEIVFVSEFTDKVIKAPSGWTQMIDNYCPHKETEILNSKVVEVTKQYIPIDCIAFDGKNARLMGFDPDEELTQEECYLGLLADGDTDDHKKAISRRIQIAELGCIAEAIIVKWDSSIGKYVVYEGNSRTAYSRDLVSQASSAEGYRNILAIVFDEDTPDELLEEYKQKVQSRVTLDHGKARDAADMYRKFKNGMSMEAISRSFGEKYSEGIVEGSIGTIEWMRNEGILDDQRLFKVYSAAYSLYAIPKTKKNYWAKRGCDMSRLLHTLASPSIDSTWLKSAGYRQLNTALNTISQEYIIEAITGFADQKEGWASVSEWKTSYKELKEKNKKELRIKESISQIKGAVTNVKNLNDNLASTIESLEHSKSKNFDHKVLGDYSQSSRNQLNDISNELGELLWEMRRKLKDIAELVENHTENFE